MFYICLVYNYFESNNNIFIRFIVNDFIKLKFEIIEKYKCNFLDLRRGVLCLSYVV